MKEALLKDQVKQIEPTPINNLGYFMEWGAKTWERLMAYAFDRCLGTNLQGQQVLEIGTRYGKMACLFALLGAKVIGLDVRKKCLPIAQREATKWNVTERVAFVLGGRDLSIFKNNCFDIVFSKSVLVLVPDLARFLEEINAKLRPGGKVVFLENAKGPWFVHMLRALWHWEWDHTKARYFTQEEVGVVSSVFDEIVVERRVFPPVVLIMGRKRVGALSLQS